MQGSLSTHDTGNKPFLESLKIDLITNNRDEELHNIMDLNKVFPKPKEVEERLKKNRNNQIIKLIYK